MPTDEKFTGRIQNIVLSIMDGEYRHSYQRLLGIRSQQDVTPYAKLRADFLLLLLEPLISHKFFTGRQSLLESTLQLANTLKGTGTKRGIVGHIKGRISHELNGRCEAIAKEGRMKKYASKLGPSRLVKPRKEERKKQKQARKCRASEKAAQQEDVEKEAGQEEMGDVIEQGVRDG